MANAVHANDSDAHRMPVWSTARSVRAKDREPDPEPTIVDLTVVVVTHNSANVIGGLLASLEEGLEAIDTWQLVVIDNDSHDNTLERIAATGVPATVVATGRNRGYAAGLNTALDTAAPSRAVLLLNPDVRLQRGCAWRLLYALGGDVGMAVPHLTDARGVLAPSLRRDPTVLRALGEALLGGRLAGRIPALGEVVRSPGAYAMDGNVDWATGAVVAIDRRCLDMVGPWDERFFLYSEETEYAIRARQAGFRLRYVADAGAQHLGGESGTSPRLWSLLTTNRVRCYAMRHDRVKTLAFAAAIALGQVLRLPLRRGVHRAALTELARIAPWAARP